MCAVFRLFKLILFISALGAVFQPFEASAQEIFVRKDNSSTEIFLRIAPEAISSVDRDGAAAVVVNFTRPMRSPFSQNVDDEFVASIEGSGTRLRVSFKPAADYAVFNDAQGLRLIASRPREMNDVLLSYGVAAPMLKKEDLSTDNPIIEAQFRQAENFARNRQFDAASNIYESIIATTPSNYYKAEATYRLGNLYMQMGDYDPMYYYDASTTFDGFIRDFPDNNRILQVKVLTADAKRKNNMMTEAADAYKEVYNDAQDAQTRRMALEQIADIYMEIGQYDGAIEAYEEYLREFQTGADLVKSAVGKLYLMRGYDDRAYELFSQVPTEVLLESPSNEILQLAKIFDTRGDTAKAEEMYRNLADGNTPETLEALTQLAQLSKNRGDMDAYANYLQLASERDATSELGKQALVEYAEVHYAERTADEWREYLDPIYSTQDEFNLMPRAEIVQIKAMYKDGDTGRLVSKIDNYIRDYPESTENPWLLTAKEEVLYNKAVKDEQAKNYYPALDTYNQLLQQFPESTRVPAITQSIDDIYYNMAKELFDAGKYAEAVDAVEARMLQMTTPVAPRWDTLWEDAEYNDIITRVGAVSPRETRFKAREYLSTMPKGRYVNEIRGVLEQNFNDPYNAAANAGDSATVIKLYEENRPWLESWPNQAYANRAKVNVTKALLDLDLRPQAEQMYQSMTPMMTNDYAELGYGLCQKDVIYDINRLAAEEFLKIVDEAERCGDPQYTLNLISKYTADRKTALKAEYELAKNISDDKTRENVLNDVYGQLVADEANRFDAYEEVYLDMGLLSYRKNDFAGAVVPLQNYADVAPDTSEKKAEALYYIGKSLMGMNERDRAFEYFRRVAAMPPSIYVNMAQSELEDNAWRNGN